MKEVNSMITPNPIMKRRLGNTHMEVSIMSLGGAGLGGIFGSVGDADGIAAVEKGLELGLNWLDTSPKYGQAERRMGMALRGVPRDRYYISSKVGTHPDRGLDYSSDAAYWTVENSLKVLGIDYLDICLIHEPEPHHLEEALRPNGALEALIELKKQGVIKSIGIGVQSHELIHKAIDTGHLDMALTVNDYTLLRQSVIEGVCDYAEQQNIGVVNGAALAMGLLSGVDPKKVGTPKWQPPQNELESALHIYQWCQERGVSILSLALQFSLRQPRFATTLIGAATAKEVQGCWDAVTAEIPQAIWDELPALLDKVRIP
jgi:aryl-alcohol dehydrogenase-like predicted oxidoreductase